MCVCENGSGEPLCFYEGATDRGGRALLRVGAAHKVDDGGGRTNRERTDRQAAVVVVVDGGGRGDGVHSLRQGRLPLRRRATERSTGGPPGPAGRESASEEREKKSTARRGERGKKRGRAQREARPESQRPGVLFFVQQKEPLTAKKATQRPQSATDSSFSPIFSIFFKFLFGLLFSRPLDGRLSVGSGRGERRGGPSAAQGTKKENGQRQKMETTSGHRGRRDGAPAVSLTALPGATSLGPSGPWASSRESSLPKLPLS